MSYRFFRNNTFSESGCTTKNFDIYCERDCECSRIFFFLNANLGQLKEGGGVKKCERGQTYKRGNYGVEFQIGETTTPYNKETKEEEKQRRRGRKTWKRVGSPLRVWVQCVYMCVGVRVCVFNCRSLC